ncbi:MULTISPECIES: hypothetical protein [Sellimonas]|uniref:Uncharacterized protein n=1 Tax=Sellimonas caecigallum TaxID=2592333 RepID=A0ABS7L3B7_9FIRM|nr:MULTISPECIES: hypothetical protein [Sellimonas]MBY0757554.1 hypothetical protein [Sellimonas caecigallum]OUP02868.1 hypothetical protein B5F37_02645 [Drancourtella sp. An210]OUP65012.1 hypothetical protein B5F13_06785 [Drancourtella sp. An177]
MYENGAAVLQMKKVFLKSEKQDRKKYMTRIRTYDSKSEEMSLYVGKGEVQSFSLDAVYECIFEAEEGRYGCEGVITRRYHDQDGEQIVLRIQNGLYVV